MRNPKRYICKETGCDCCASVLRDGFVDAPEGEYVRYADYAALQAETVKQIEAALPPVEAYIAKLEAENERLRKAGDAMAAIIRPPAHGPGEWDGEYEAWLAAKGVQS